MAQLLITEVFLHFIHIEIVFNFMHSNNTKSFFGYSTKKSILS